MSGMWYVTGANGYLGAALCRGLSQSGFAVCALARAGRALDGLHESGVDTREYEALPDTLSAGDVLVHCAGKVCSTGRWEDYEAINVDWALSLFDVAESAGASAFVYISSIAALGYSNRSAETPLDEDSEPMLLDGELYGRSKFLAEQRLRARADGSATRLILLRPGLVYGRRPMPSPSGWLRRGSVVDAGQRVPLVHVDSVLSAVLKTGGDGGAAGTFFVVDDEQPTLGALNALKRKLGLLHRKPWPLGRTGFRLLCLARGAARRARGLNAPPAGYVEAQYAMQTRRLRYSAARLREATGWAPAYTLEAGMAEVANCTQNGVT